MRRERFSGGPTLRGLEVMHSRLAYALPFLPRLTLLAVIAMPSALSLESLTLFNEPQNDRVALLPQGKVLNIPIHVQFAETQGA